MSLEDGPTLSLGISENGKVMIALTRYGAGVAGDMSPEEARAFAARLVLVAEHAEALAGAK